MLSQLLEYAPSSPLPHHTTNAFPHLVTRGCLCFLAQQEYRDAYCVSVVMSFYLLVGKYSAYISDGNPLLIIATPISSTLLPILAFLVKSFCSPCWPGTHYGDQAGLELTGSTCHWDYRHALPHPAVKPFFMTSEFGKLLRRQCSFPIKLKYSLQNLHIYI